MCIKIAFHVDSFGDQTSFIWELARLNEEVLGNASVIVHSCPAGVSSFPAYSYSESRDIDELAFKYKIRIFYREYTSPINQSLPTTVCNCVYYPGGTGTPFGDVYVAETFHSAALFDSLFVQPALKIIHTFGYRIGGLTAIFLGTTTSENISLFNIPPVAQISAPVNVPITWDRRISTPGLGTKGRKIFKVLPLCNWTSTEQLIKDWHKMSNGADGWKSAGVEIILSADVNPDYYVIINKPCPGAVYDPAKTIVFRMEPYIESIPHFNDWLPSGGKDAFLYFLEHSDHRNCTEWWLSSTPEQLLAPVEKTRGISAVVSSQYNMEGHKLRIDFMKYLNAHSQLRVDIYGHDNKHGLLGYCGSLPTRAKDQGIFPYKYHIAAENSDIANYFTEKFHDAILGECLLFYWGCSNIEEHVNSRAFIRLDLKDPKASLKIIEDSIAGDEWGKRIKIIREEKAKIVEHLSFFPRVCSLIAASQIRTSSASSISIPGVKFSLIEKISTPITTAQHNLLRNCYCPIIMMPQLENLITHAKLWNLCAREDKIHCILSGDPKANFLDHLTTLLSSASDREWDIIFLSWEPRNHSDEVLSRQLLTPAWDHVLSNTIDHPTIIGTKTIDSGSIASGYLLHPRGARKLMDIFNLYGFFAPLDELFLMLHQVIQLETYISSKNLVYSARLSQSEPYHLFHKNLITGKFSNTPVNFTFPPSHQGEVTLIANSQFNNLVESRKLVQG